MSLSEYEVERVCTAVKGGAKLLVGRDPLGRQKIKVVKGPFGLFVERYTCDAEDLREIRTRLNKSNTAKQ
jgi:hypothetical protein